MGLFGDKKVESLKFENEFDSGNSESIGFPEPSFSEPSKSVDLIQNEFTPSEAYGVTFFNDPVQLRGRRVNRAILIGEATVLSFEKTKFNDFVTLTPRATGSGFKVWSNRKSPKCFISVDENFIDGSNGNIAYALAHDVYLQWGFKSKGKLVLIGGFLSEYKTNIQVYFFEDGILKKTEERLIEAPTNELYEESFSGMFGTFGDDFEDAKICYAFPLKEFASPPVDMEYIDVSIFKNIKFTKLGRNRSSTAFKLIAPGVVALVGCGVYAGYVVKGWDSYTQSIDRFDTALNDPLVKEVSGVGPSLITKIQKQRVFLSHSDKQVLFLEKTRNLVNAVARINGVRIVDLTVHGPGEDKKLEGDETEISIYITVPNTTGRGALEMGKEILDSISSGTGLSLRVANQGWKDIDKRRAFTIEGNFSG